MGAEYTKPTVRFVGKMRDLFFLNSCVTILDNTSVTIENCTKILECTDVLVKLRSKRFEIEIWGTDMTVDNYSSGGVEVGGIITNVAISPVSARSGG